MSPYDLERNDVDGAARIYEEATRTAGPEELSAVTRLLLRLQDDPAELIARISAISAR